MALLSSTARRSLRNASQARFTLPSRGFHLALTSSPQPNETLARFILSSGHLNKTRSRVKPRAFEPAPDTRTTSVFRIDGLDEPSVWASGHEHVADPQEMPLHGRAELLVEAVNDVGLHV